MNTVEHISTNASAVIDRKKLTRSERDILNRYALANCSSYCAGCSEICDYAMPEAAPYISDIMRYLMYYNSYNEKEMARGLFAEIPAPVRRRLTRLDYRAAEKRCPQGLMIGSLIAEAVQKLA
jgi:predicted aldo/keto reductase-like oxidoreductase